MQFVKSTKSYIYIVAALAFITYSCHPPQTEVRKEYSLNNSWKSIANDSSKDAYNGFEKPDYNDNDWLTIDVPHNWDTYHGYLRKVHGNRHGYAWYRKEFKIADYNPEKRYFLFFEGVGSYATVWVNGKLAGSHAGGRTTFTLDITKLINPDKINILAVRADHPAEIMDLPWVCGGCSTERGFSEGSQPMGIFRPVTLIETNNTRIEPFGVHVWNDTSITQKLAHVNIDVELKNYESNVTGYIIRNILKDSKGKTVAKSEDEIELNKNELKEFNTSGFNVKNPNLWSPDNPYLYQLHTQIVSDNQIIDELVTPVGIRTISWPIKRNDGDKRFFVNHKPVFINGVGEYEHMFGQSHAFTEEQIDARISQIKAAGFNAFRDAHQPHNLRYQEALDKEGILWWTQLSAHIWFDNPEFRKNFKTLLREWVKERRNNPSNIVWGLQNESTLPTDFSEECTAIIREMDPTSPSQRIVTTCNGGTGTDWNVIQNWSGTYGGEPEIYDQEIKRDLLNGEYGAWRSIDLHTEGPFNQNGILSEDRMTQLLEMKVRLAEEAKDSCVGQFLWIFSSHDNPGRIQSGEALRDIDRLGPINYKGLLTPWGEPLDVYYMYRANYVSANNEPMVYIVSHTWPNRWSEPGIKDNITVYSNCDEVELFNGVKENSLGKLPNKGFGYPFVWDKAEIKTNVLYAVGYKNGQAVAEDIIVLNHLPQAPGIKKLKETSHDVVSDKGAQKYLYRVNCGGSDYTDRNGNLWMADRHLTKEGTWGSLSWTDHFKGLPAYFGSQRRTFDPIENTSEWKLFQTFRYGLTDLSYKFPVENGSYTVELYFSEPWYGTGGGLDCKNWRLFDVAINKDTVIRDFDIWKEVGHDKAIKKTFKVNVENNQLCIHFPKTKSGQALISAIAISGDENSKVASPSPLVIENMVSSTSEAVLTNWLDWGDKLFTNSDETIKEIPSNLFGCTWVKTSKNTNNQISFNITEESDVFIALDSSINQLPSWAKGFISTDNFIVTDNKDQDKYKVYGKRFPAGSSLDFGNKDLTKDDIKNNFAVFVTPSSDLDAPTDQRPVKIFSSEDARIKGNGVKRVIDGRHFIEIMTNDPVKVEFDFYVGLASTYGIHFKFQNNSGGDVQNDMLITTKSGKTMTHEQVEMYDKPGKWRTVKTSTGTTINAGDYKVSLVIKNAKGLLLQHLEVQ